MYTLARLLATHPDSAVRDGPRAVRWAEHLVRQTGGASLEAIDTLAAAYAEVGRFEEAIETATQAIRIAEANDRAEFARAVGERVSLYRAGRPCRETP